MKKKYFLNTSTGTLHITGYCHQTKCLPYHIEWFDTEEEAHLFAGRSIKPCKVCDKKKEKLLKKEVLY